MGGESISWTAGNVIYKAGDHSEFAYLLTKDEVEIISDKGTRVGFINENEVFWSIINTSVNQKNSYYYCTEGI